MQKTTIYIRLSIGLFSPRRRGYSSWFQQDDTDSVGDLGFGHDSDTGVDLPKSTIQVLIPEEYIS